MSRPGFSLVEVMIAIVILTTGVLALAATSANVIRLTSLGNRLGGSAVIAEGRLELLRSQAAPTTPTNACASLTSGSTVEGPYTETWTVTTPSGAAVLRNVVLTVAYQTGRSTRTDTYSTTISCAR